MVGTHLPTGVTDPRGSRPGVPESRYGRSVHPARGTYARGAARGPQRGRGASRVRGRGRRLGVGLDLGSAAALRRPACLKDDPTPVARRPRPRSPKSLGAGDAQGRWEEARAASVGPRGLPPPVRGPSTPRRRRRARRAGLAGGAPLARTPVPGTRGHPLTRGALRVRPAPRRSRRRRPPSPARPRVSGLGPGRRGRRAGHGRRPRACWGLGPDTAQGSGPQGSG